MHYLLATADSSVSPEFMGMLVIALMQLSQLVFAYRKDQARVESVKKEDLAALRKELKAENSTLREELKGEIAEVSEKAEKIRDGLSAELKSMSHDSEVARGELHEKINTVAIQTASLVKGQEHTDQALVALTLKLDNLLSRTRRTR